MRATMMYGARDVRVVNVPDATLVDPTDAIVRVTRACICGSDLWPYRLMEASETGQSMDHEAIGVVEAVGRAVGQVKVGDVVIMPFASSDGRCEFCHEGLHTACVHGGFFGYAGVNGAQAEALWVPQADGTLYVLPGGADEAMIASLLTLSDVMARATMPRVSRKQGLARRWPSSATARSVCAGCWRRSASGRSRSS